LIDRIAGGRLAAEIAVVVADRPGIGALERAERAGVPALVVARAGLDRPAFGQSVFDAIRAHQSDLVILAGFLSLLPIPADYRHKVLNIHPALIPAFCGRGYHGEAVHRAALETGVKVSGCTVHFADDTYDTGPIVLQRVVPVLADDTPAALAGRVFEAECQALPESIDLYAAGRLQIEGRRVRVLPA
jgi:phosphoribosylglycinamide formyltransferase-1